MIRYKFYYTNGEIEIKGFKTEREALLFVHNEGDHLIKVEKCLL